MAPDNPHAVLGLARDASAQQVTEAYRALAQIYHPDRYADAPPRVREESLRRMQALNAAYEAIRRGAPAAARDAAPPAEEPAATRDPAPRATLHYVDGSPLYHAGDVAPLGLDLSAQPVRRATTTNECGRLNAELVAWFANQRRNAPMTDKLLYAAWDHEQQSIYTATVGCNRISEAKAAALADPCPECAPAAS